MDLFDQTIQKRLAVLVAVALALGIFAPSEGTAQQASTSSTQQDAAVTAGGESGGQATLQDTAGHDFTSPEDLFQLRYRYKTAPGPGRVKGTIRTVTTNTLYVRSDFTVDLDSRWKVVFRTDLPFVAKDPISSDHPSGDYLYGVGDVAFQAALIEQIDQQWAAGGGLRIIAPTGADNITTGKWQIMPIVGARTTLPELSAGSYFEPLLRYVVSVAGDPTKKHISNLQLDPMLRIGLPDRWFLILYPSADIRVNYGDRITGQTGRLFLPFDFSVGRSLTKYFTVSLEVGVPIIKNYPVYNFKTTAWLTMKF